MNKTLNVTSAQSRKSLIFRVADLEDPALIAHLSRELLRDVHGALTEHRAWVSVSPLAKAWRTVDRQLHRYHGS